MKGTASTSTKRVPATQVQPGDLADHKSRTLDPRPVCRVEGKSIWIKIGTLEAGPLTASNYTFTRRVVSA